MALEFSPQFHFSDGPPIFPYPLSPESCSLLQNIIFDNHVNPSYQLFEDIETVSPSSSVAGTSNPEYRQTASCSPTNSASPADLPLSDFDIESPLVAIRGNSGAKPNAEAAARRRREQNRASQRAYRARRDRHIEMLEQNNLSLQRHISTLTEENELLRKQLLHLQAENGSANCSEPRGISLSPSPGAEMLHEGENLSLNKPLGYRQDHIFYQFGHATSVMHKLEVERGCE